MVIFKLLLLFSASKESVCFSAIHWQWFTIWLKSDSRYHYVYHINGSIKDFNQIATSSEPTGFLSYTAFNIESSVTDRKPMGSDDEIAVVWFQSHAVKMQNLSTVVDIKYQNINCAYQFLKYRTSTQLLQKWQYMYFGLRHMSWIKYCLEAFQSNVGSLYVFLFIPSIYTELSMFYSHHVFLKKGASSKSCTLRCHSYMI